MSEVHRAVSRFPSLPPWWHGRGPENDDPRSLKVPARDIQPGKKLRAVIVDDESAIAETLVEILTDEGFEAAAASDGDSAIELIQSFRPDIVISDVVIPGVNGVEVGIRIRELLPKCRIILFSGQAATVDLLKQARERGYEFEILAKPIRPEALLSIIRDPGSVAG